MTSRTSSEPPIAGRRIRGLDATERAQQRRELILDTALELFARDGYANTSIETLCQTAFVGNKAFYENFTTKEACYLELLQRNTNAIVAQVTTAVTDLPADEHVGTRHVISTLAAALLDDPRVATVTFGQAAGISPTIDRQRRANRRQSAELVLAVWRHFGHTGDKTRQRMLAIAVIGGLFDLISDALDRSDNSMSAAEVEQLIADMTDFALVASAGLRA
ncbi:TetR/AcrR family transcriptional regulator [Gordonia effusa]|uniref:TetR/AcrR family transcriptional regulator n=1 Tax=Gordonia effusa TaxID=263908 RepID=UPI00031F4540|nr:TetR/AcrR family transcriptional regulator [Gordonia effusa]